MTPSFFGGWKAEVGLVGVLVVLASHLELELALERSKRLFLDYRYDSS